MRRVRSNCIPGYQVSISLNSEFEDDYLLCMIPAMESLIRTNNSQEFFDMPQSSIWTNCLTRLESELSEQEINQWLRPLDSEFEAGVLHLYTPNQYALSAINEKYLNLIADTASSLNGTQIGVELKVSNTRRGRNVAQHGHFVKSDKRTQTKEQNTQVFGFTPLSDEFTLANHVMGESNRLARMVIESIGDTPGLRDYNPLFLYGTVGIGKTHLMQAAGHRMLESNPSAKIGYVHANNFKRHLVNSFRSNEDNKLEQFKHSYRSLDALLADDIHMFAGANASQQEFLQTFNSLLEGDKQIIITCDRFFKELDDVEDRLKSRLGQGIHIRVDPPEFETRMAILAQKAEKRGVVIEEDVLHFIASKIQSNVRELEGALNRLIADHRLLGLPITIDLVKRALADLIAFNSKPLDIETIQKEVANYYGIRVQLMVSGSRKKEITLARHMAMRLARELTNISLPEIGKAFNGRNHATVIHACKSIDEKIKQSSRIANEHTVLSKMLAP